MHAHTFIVEQNNFIVVMVVMAKVGLKPQNHNLISTLTPVHKITQEVCTMYMYNVYVHMECAFQVINYCVWQRSVYRDIDMHYVK
jgi:hypothetical protein